MATTAGMLRVTSVGVILVGSIVAVNDTRLWVTLQRLLSAWPEWVLVIMWLCGYILTIIIIKLYVKCMSVAGGTHEADYNSPKKQSEREEERNWNNIRWQIGIGDGEEKKTHRFRVRRTRLSSSLIVRSCPRSLCRRLVGGVGVHTWSPRSPRAWRMRCATCGGRIGIGVRREDWKHDITGSA